MVKAINYFNKLVRLHQIIIVAFARLNLGLKFKNKLYVYWIKNSLINIKHGEKGSSIQYFREALRSSIQSD